MCSNSEMKKIAKDAGIDVKLFNSSQIKQIASGLLSGVDVSIYAKPEYDYNQMNQIRLGIKTGIDVSVYANPTYNFEKMQEIRCNIMNRKMLCEKDTEGSHGVLIYIPSTQEVMEIRCDGDGSQMLPEDYKEGYVDYVYAETFEYVGAAETDCGFNPGDGELYLTKEPIKDMKSILFDFLCKRYNGMCPDFVMMNPNVV